jgi:2',3'-cyclic-nucleotide 2'-phosphodiesterase (5'-nucleotidase family)
VEPDRAIAAMVEDYARAIGPILDRVVATLDRPLVRSGREHALGNLVADAQRRATGADVAIMNNGGLRTDLQAGPVRYEDLFRVQPFGNTLVVLELTGAGLIQAVEHSMSGGRSGGHFSGLRVRYRLEAEDGRRVVSATLESGADVQPNAVYRVVVNNFLAEGGDGYTMLLEGRRPDYTGIVDLDALLDHLAALPSPTPLPATDPINPVGATPPLTRARARGLPTSESALGLPPTATSSVR